MKTRIIKSMAFGMLAGTVGGSLGILLNLSVYASMGISFILGLVLPSIFDPAPSEEFQPGDVVTIYDETASEYTVLPNGPDLLGVTLEEFEQVHGPAVLLSDEWFVKKEDLTLVRKGRPNAKSN